MSKLERFFRQGNPENVMAHLAKIRKPEIVAMGLEHDSFQVKSYAQVLLNVINTPEAAAAVLKRLSHRDVYVRRAALSALNGMSRQVVARSAKIIARKMFTPFTRESEKEDTAELLRKLGNPEVLPELREAEREMERIPFRRGAQDVVLLRIQKTIRALEEVERSQSG
ncbi:MAG TPA: hypothetical protein VGQ00_00895 [Candidatus Norongarragalinales archaeon]|jgi:HEAT repeat protein|nr:hypothetical protein [Candidatus Norongarragalinales archaeon]